MRILLLAWLVAGPAFAPDEDQGVLTGAVIRQFQAVLTGSPEERDAAGTRLVGMNFGGSILSTPAVAKMVDIGLGHPDAKVREVTCRFLQSKRNVDPTLQKRILDLHSSDPVVEVRAAALAASNGPISVQPTEDRFNRLRAGLAQDDLVAQEAKGLLMRAAKQVSPEIGHGLVDDLASENAFVRQTAAEALIARADALKAYDLLLEGAGAARPEEAASLREALARMKPSAPRAKALHKTLGKMRGGTASEKLAAEVGDARLKELGLVPKEKPGKPSAADDCGPKIKKINRKFGEW